MISCLLYCLVLFSLSNASISDGQPKCRKNRAIVPQLHQLRNIKPFCNTSFAGNTSICGIGIIPKTNEKCFKWKSSAYNDNKILENTTFCKQKSSSFYCATKYSWDYCKDINCTTDNKNNICDSDIQWSSTPSSITLNASQTSATNSILLFSYDSKDGCVIFKICLKCLDLNEIVKNHFATCENLKENSSGSQTISYQNLNSNTQYKFYLIPIIDKMSIGSIGMVTLETISDKPAIPTDVRVIHKTATNISIQWDSSNKMIFRGSFNEYQIQMLEVHNNITSITYTTKKNFSLGSLRPCTMYCFRIRACNNYGGSESVEMCTNTTSNFETAKWILANSTMSNTKNLTWSYKNDASCHTTFIIEYWPFDILNETKIIKTKNRFVILKDLNDDMDYVVRVRPESGNEHGHYSTEMLLHTRRVIRQTSKLYWPIIIIIAILAIPLIYFLYRKGYLLIWKRKTLSLVFPRVVKRFPSTTRSNQIYETHSDIINQLNENRANACSIIEDTESDAYGFVKFEGSQIYVCINDSIRESEYQNVNFVSLLTNPNETEFIIGENPSNESVFDFWYIVWIQKVSMIVMLTSDIFDCMKYWPKEKEVVWKYGKYFQFSVVLKFENKTNTYTERRINVFNEIKSEGRTITHFQIHNWSGFSSSKIHSFDETILKFQECKENGNLPPYLIHTDINFCGVGAFIVVDRIVGKLLNNVRDINIFREISKIQTNKSVMVHHQAQYIFIPEFVQYFSRKYNKDVNLVDF